MKGILTQLMHLLPPLWQFTLFFTLYQTLLPSMLHAPALNAPCFQTPQHPVVTEAVCWSPSGDVMVIFSDFGNPHSWPHKISYIFWGLQDSLWLVNCISCVKLVESPFQEAAHQLDQSRNLVSCETLCILTVALFRSFIYTMHQKIKEVTVK